MDVGESGCEEPMDQGSGRDLGPSFTVLPDVSGTVYAYK